MAGEATWRRPGRLAIAAVLSFLPALLAAATPDAFEWLQPVVIFDAGARMRLEQGGVVSKLLPAADGEVGIFITAAVNADGETLAAWASSIAQLKASRYVLAIRRFSDPPSLEDLQDLVLEDGDVEAVRRCRSGDCEVKMAASDIERLRQAAADGGVEWKTAVQREFRRPHSPPLPTARRTSNPGRSTGPRPSRSSTGRKNSTAPESR